MKFSIYVLLSLSVLGVYAADVRFFGFTKGEGYVQESTGTPVLASGQPFQFRAFVLLNITNPITATIKWPNTGATKPLTNYSQYAERTDSALTRSSLNFAAPNGVYTMVIQTPSSGQKTISLNLSTDFYPSIPRISNFGAAQGIDPAINFILRWDNPVTTDFIQLKLFDGDDLIFETPDAPQTPGALTGASNAVVLPKGLLTHGKVYQGRLIAWKKISSDLTTYPGGVGYAAYTRQTDLNLRTLWNVTDVNWIGLSKITRYNQTSVQPPTLAPANPHEFQTFVEGADGKVLGGQIRTPSGTAKSLAKITGTRWQLTDRYATAAQRDAAYANGTYEMSVQTMNNGTPKIPLPLNQAVAPIPHINNWNDVNAIDSTKPFVLSWAPLGGGTNDFLQVKISKQGQVVFQTPSHPRAAGALNGTSQGVTIPSGLLQPGETCECSITYLKASSVDTFSYPGALGYAGAGAESSAILRAKGGNVSAPLLSQLSWNNGRLIFEVASVTGRQYTIQGSTDLRAWNTLLITNAPSDSWSFQLAPSPQLKVLVLRALVN